MPRPRRQQPNPTRSRSPPPTSRHRRSAEPADGFEDSIALRQRVRLRWAEGVGLATGVPSGQARIDGWIRLATGREPDPLSLLLFSDAMPPSMFEAEGMAVGHIPTVQLTTHLFALPAPGWIQARFRTRVRGGGFLDEDGELWGSRGCLVATARQLALLR